MYISNQDSVNPGTSTVSTYSKNMSSTPNDATNQYTIDAVRRCINKNYRKEAIERWRKKRKKEPMGAQHHCSPGNKLNIIE